MLLMGVLDRLGLLNTTRNCYNSLRYAFKFSVRRQNKEYLLRGAPDGFPLPPPTLIHLIGGSYSLENFIINGRHGAGCIRRILEKNDIPMESLGSLLDFGCGCGRVIRNWAGLENTRICGTDYNPELVNWCRDHLAFGEFRVNGLSGRLEYPDNQFDFIYAISVFTHLPARLQAEWLRELIRVTAPGGHLYITVLGTRHKSKMSKAEWDRFNAGEMIVQWEKYAGTNICRVFHPEEYFRKNLPSGVHISDFVPGGAEDAEYQDVLLLEKLHA